MTDPKSNFLFRWYDEVWNKHNESAIDQMLYTEIDAHGLTNKKMIDSESFKQFYRAFNEAFTNINVTLDQQFADGDFLIALITVKATNNRTQKDVEFTGSAVAQLKDGKMINAWNNLDFLSMHIQLGNIQPEALVL
jgi:predicted ester cyclase